MRDRVGEPLQYRHAVNKQMRDLISEGNTRCMEFSFEAIDEITQCQAHAVRAPM
jgi:hypothetical protein